MKNLDNLTREQQVGALVAGSIFGIAFLVAVFCVFTLLLPFALRFAWNAVQGNAQLFWASILIASGATMWIAAKAERFADAFAAVLPKIILAAK